MDKRGLQISALPFLLAGVGVLGFALGGGTPDESGDASSGGNNAPAVSGKDSAPAPKTDPSVPFPENLKVSFDGIDAKTTIITFTSDTVAEKVVGVTANTDVPSGVDDGGELDAESEKVNPLSGWLKMDGKALTGSAEFTIHVNSLRTGIDTRDEHLRGSSWMHAAKFPKITYKVDKFTHITGDKFAVEGVWTMKGVSKPLKTEATVRFITSEVANNANINWNPSDQAWLRVQSSFAVDVTQFGVDISSANGKVKPVWDVTVDVFGKVE